MKTGRRYNPILGKLLFAVPALVLIIVVVYAFVQLNTPGTLMVVAETPGGHQLQVSATVDGKTGQTPWTLSLSQGNYVVNFTAISWYRPPDSRDVGIVPGVTAYAVAVYYPLDKVIQVTASGFNGTVVTALHGVTPVNFTNPASSAITFDGSPFGSIVLEPGQTFSYTYSTSGIYTYTILYTNETITVDVG